MNKNPMNYVLIIIVLVSLEFGLDVYIANAGNDWVQAWLRSDSIAISGADDYQIYLYPITLPTTEESEQVVADWIGVDNGPRIQENFSFIQVGFYADKDGLRWFVEAPYGPLVKCLRGTGNWQDYGNGYYGGCRGDINDLVVLNGWTQFELVTYNQQENGHYFWIARVFDLQHNVHFDVAKFYVDGMHTITNAYVSMEEAWSSGSDPYLQGEFYNYLPQYHGSGGWVNWPLSNLPHDSIGVDYNYIWVNPAYCPSYISVIPNALSFARMWYVGTNGNVCNWTLFPPESSSGITDDSNLGLIDYEVPSGWWHQVPGPTWYRALGSTLSYKKTLNDSYSFTFNGTSITRIYGMVYNRGTARIYIDGNLIEIDNDNIATPPRWQIAKTWSVPDGDHTIQVYNNTGGSNGYTDIDAFWVNMPSVSSGIYDDADLTDIIYFANGQYDWNHATGWPQDYNQTISVNNVTGDGFRFTFTGTSITYYFSKALNRGYAGVIIDGIDMGVIDEYSSITQFQYPITYNNLGPGMHTIEVTVMGQKNPSSTDYKIDLDHFVVSP